jgi:hypothetical protein
MAFPNMDNELQPDQVIEYYKQFVDRDKLRENLQLTVDERLQRLERVAAERPNKRREPPGPERPWKPISDCGPGRGTDPIIELYKQDVDRTLLRENLKLTPDQRLLKLSDFMRLAEEMRTARRLAWETG